MVLPESLRNRLRSLERREVSLHPFEKKLLSLNLESLEASLTGDQENATPVQTPPRANRKSVLGENVSSPRNANFKAFDTPYTTVEKVGEPHSKAALGRLSYDLDDTPKLLGVDLVVESTTDTPDLWKYVESARLRHNAIKAWLKPLKLHGFSTTVALGKDGKARLAIRFRDDLHMNSITESLNSAQSDVPNVKKSKRSSGADSQQYDLRIRITDIQHATSEAKSIASDFRGVMRGLIPLESLPESILKVDARLPEIRKNDKKNVEPATVHVHGLHTRVEPTLDLAADKPKLHLHFEVVPVVSETALIDVLNDLVGRKKGAAKLISEHIDAIARTLRGLHVRCMYKPLGSTAKGGGRVLTGVSLLEGQHEGRRFQVKDIKMLKDVKHHDGEGREITFSLEQYFESVRIHNNAKININLPFVQDDSRAWIPIELVEVDGVQPVPNARHLYQAIREQARTFLKQGGAHYLYKIGERVLQSHAIVDTPNGNGSEPWLHGKPDSEGFSASSIMSNDAKPLVEPSQNESAQSVGLVYVCDAAGTVNQDLVNKLKAGLEYHEFSLAGDVQKLNGSEVLDNSLKIKASDASLLLAVIGKGHNNEVAAKLQHYADCQLSMHMVILKEGNIAGRFAEATRHGGAARIPATVRAKINCKLGKQTFAHAELQKLLRGGNVMVAAAHITHLVEKKKYFPSITSVVASQNDSALQFSGRASLQRTTKALEEATLEADIRQYYDCKISGLESTMQGLFEGWKRANKGKLPTELIFFRDSIDFEDVIIQTELQEIQSAYSHVTAPAKRSEIYVTYIVVNKNQKLQYKSSNTPAAGKTTPVSDYFAEDDNIGKYRYYVIRNDAGRTDLPTLTRCLNESSQLTSQYEQTAKALPLLYASKLSERVHSYFRYDPKAVTEIEPVKRKSGEITRRTEAEDAAVAKVNTLLTSNAERGLSAMGPWKASLDGTMFYL